MTHRVIDHGDPKKYWTQIPNIVFDLGLSPHELSLYVHLRRTAGTGGKCFKSTRTLAKETGMGIATVSRTKTELEKPREVLGGKPLIRTAKRPNPKGGKDYDEIRLTDIWLVNTQRFTSSVEELDATEQVPETSDQVPVRNLASSTVEHKKNSSEEELKKPSAHTRLMDFHSGYVGTVLNAARQGKHVKDLLAAGYSADDCEACYKFLLTEEWCKSVNWGVVAGYIGGWLVKQKQNGHEPKPDRTAREATMAKAMGWDRIPT